MSTGEYELCYYDDQNKMQEFMRNYENQGKELKNIKSSITILNRRFCIITSIFSCIILGLIVVIGFIYYDTFVDKEDNTVQNTQNLSVQIDQLENRINYNTVELVGGNHTHGNAFFRGKPICDDKNWNDYAATVFCKMLGFSKVWFIAVYFVIFNKYLGNGIVQVSIW